MLLRLDLYGLIARVLLGFAVARVLRAVAPGVFMPQPEWGELPGQYAVGVRDVDMVDVERAEPEVPEQRRRIMARIWYPAAPNTLPRRALHAPDEAAWLAQHGPRSMKQLKELSSVQTAAAQHAPVLQQGPRMPLLLFSHGLGGVVSQNTRLCESLASTGYVVVSITHPYGGASVRYTDTSEALLTREMVKRRFDLASLQPIVTGVRLAKTVAQALRAAKGLLSVSGLQAELRLWVEDTSAVLGLLREGRVSPPIPDVLGLVDFERVGAFGMSFGGAASAAVAHEDQRIAAAVNLDGNQFGRELWDTNIRVPLLELRSDEAMIPSGGSFNNFHYEKHSEAGSSGRVQRYHVKGSTHAAFTDMVLLGSPLQKRLMGLGRIPGARMQALMFDLVKRFFDEHLKRDATARHQDPSLTWPELQVIDTRALRDVERI